MDGGDIRREGPLLPLRYLFEFEAMMLGGKKHLFNIYKMIILVLGILERN